VLKRGGGGWGGILRYNGGCYDSGQSEEKEGSATTRDNFNLQGRGAVVLGR